RRFARHISLKDVGVSGQEKLRDSKVLVIGAGGLGSPVLMYLAASGVGTIGIMDDDVVDLSNLQRQIIHDIDQLGVPKVISAEKKIRGIDPDIRTILYQERATAANLDSIVGEYDFVIDAVDNFVGKFLINDACVLAGVPYCHGGIREFQGQIMTYVPGQGACYRCVFEEIPRGGDVDTLSQYGVIGTIPGIIGSLQALEAQKYLLGVGELLTGKMLVFDGLTMKCRQVEFGKSSPACRVCGKDADIRQLVPEEYKVGK
ncbi:MAG: HesA/MoeB/ThiF family protein, partial [Eubacterium sp.]|nr:HesA/MoeB/ThiF family protein [Eubacterium sp.]